MKKLKQLKNKLKIEQTVNIGQFSSVADLFFCNNKISIHTGDNKERIIDRREGLLLKNHFINTKSILDLAKFHLVLSNSSIAEKLALSTSDSNTKIESDHRELFEEQSLNATLVFANASIDYLQILLMLAYTSFHDLEKLVGKEKVKNKINQGNISQNDWYVAFYAKLQEQFNNKFKDNNNNNIPKWLIKDYSKIKKMNMELKTKYQANAIKHYSVTSFLKSNTANVLRSNYTSINMDAFYSNKIHTISIGSRSSIISLKDCRSFLYAYINTSIRLFNRLYNSINIKNTSIKK